MTNLMWYLIIGIVWVIMMYKQWIGLNIFSIIMSLLVNIVFWPVSMFIAFVAMHNGKGCLFYNKDEFYEYVKSLWRW